MEKPKGTFKCAGCGEKDDRKKISVLYLRYDDGEIALAIYNQMAWNNQLGDIVPMSVDEFPRLQENLTVMSFDVVILHMMAGCHELGYRECDENFSTGLRRAEILREQGYDGKIILLTVNQREHNRRLTHNFNERVKKADVTFCGYGDGFQEIVDTIRRVVAK